MPYIPGVRGTHKWWRCLCARPYYQASLIKRQCLVEACIAVYPLQDATKDYVSLPSNRLELWFAMEAEHFMVRVRP